MKKQDSGVSMIVLIVLIVIILIISGITFKFSKELLKDRELKTDITNMLLIQARAEVINDKTAFDEGAKLIGENIVINNESSEEIQNQMEAFGIKNDVLESNLFEEKTEDDGEGNQTTTQVRVPSKWYKWEKREYENTAKAELDSLNIKLEENEFYLVNYETGEIIYSVGYKKKDGSAVIYKLSEMEALQNNE